MRFNFHGTETVLVEVISTVFRVRNPYTFIYYHLLDELKSMSIRVSTRDLLKVTDYKKTWAISVESYSVKKNNITIFEASGW